MEKKKKVVIVSIISIILVCIIILIFYFVNKKSQLVEYIKNADFTNAGKIDENFYNNYSKDIIEIVQKTGNNNFIESLTIYEKLFNYILNSKNIDYDSNSELCYKYSQVYEYLTQEIRNDYFDTEYKYIVEQAKNKKFDNRTTYMLFAFIFENEKYNTDKDTQYVFLKSKYEEFKSNDTNCRIDELCYIKEYFSKLNYEKSSEYIDEINRALKWQGSWIGFDNGKKEKPMRLSISYFGNKVYQDYVFNSSYTYSGIYDFKLVGDDILELTKNSGEPTFSNAKLRLDDEKIVYTYHYITRDVDITFVRETDENNYAIASNKILSNNPIKTSKAPQIGMTTSEVKGTKWGNPDKINKDTYSWGTTEQWVYYNRGYIYFRNGVVTSISER